jgi:hypothetical protein
LRFAKLVKIFTPFYGTKGYVNMFTRACERNSSHVLLGAGKFQISLSGAFDDADHKESVSVHLKMLIVELNTQLLITGLEE